MKGILVIGSNEIESLVKLREYAENNIVPLDDLLKQIPIGDNPNHAVRVPVDFRVVFSIEEQPSGLFRHMSVSVSREEKVPTPETIRIIAQHLGFYSGVKEGMIWKENFSGNRIAINFMEKM